MCKKSFGLASIEHNILNTPSTKYRIWSITKLFTATAVLMLYERGQFDLDDPINKLLQEYPPLDKHITVRHLLTHTSGLANYTDCEDFDQKLNKLPLEKVEVLELFANLPLSFIPGTDFAYNNSAYYLLGLLIEKMSGLSYEQFLKRAIFEPLCMQNTGLDNNKLILKQMASGYHWDGEEIVKCGYMDIETAYSAGGLYSTVEDLFHWDQAIYTEKLISKKTLEQTFIPHLDNYSLGWRIDAKFSKRRIGHGGGYRGFLSEYDRYPDEQVSIIILSNNDIPIDDVRDTLAEIVFGELG